MTPTKNFWHPLRLLCAASRAKQTAGVPLAQESGDGSGRGGEQRCNAELGVTIPHAYPIGSAPCNSDSDSLTIPPLGVHASQGESATGPTQIREALTDICGQFAGVA
eukprot:358478-Chlamydomonas_euryale.AAC.5